MTTLTQTKPQTQTTKPDAIDGKFDAAINLPPASYDLDYHLAYLKELREQDKAPF